MTARCMLPALFALGLTSAVGMGDVLLTEEFEGQGAWTKRVQGKATIELVPGGVKGKCVKISCPEQALAYYTIKLDPAKVRGRKLAVRAMVKTENVVQGPQAYSTAKFHIGGRIGKKAFNKALWFTGTTDWREEVMIALIPEDIEAPVFDLAIQTASGVAYFDNLTIDDGLKQQMALNLEAVATTNFSDGVADDGAGGFIDTGGLDLRDLPRGDVELGGYLFSIMKPGTNHGATCVALMGLKRPKLPATPRPTRKPGAKGPAPASVPVAFKGKQLLFLQAAGWPDPARKEPCLVYTIHYADGEKVDAPMQEGVDIGAFDAPADLANWKVVWTAKRQGRTVGLGVAKWENPRPAEAIGSITLRSPGKGAVPIVAGITLDRKGGDQ